MSWTNYLKNVNWNCIKSLAILNQHRPSPQLAVGIVCGILVCKLWNWKFATKPQQDVHNHNHHTLVKYEITPFSNIFGSSVYTPCKCGFPHQVCNECQSAKLPTEFPANVLLFSKSIENEVPNGGIPFTFDVPLTVDTIETIANELDISIPVQYGMVMIHYRGTPHRGSAPIQPRASIGNADWLPVATDTRFAGTAQFGDISTTKGENDENNENGDNSVFTNEKNIDCKKILQEPNYVELLWCANTSEEAKNVFPMRELLSRIIQICECSQALGYDYKPITSMIIHDIDVYL
jgi:hypothetical protein